MRFALIDRIVEVSAGKSLRAYRNLTLGEEYLADHFPTFPVMPGVLMLEAMFQASAWLIYETENYASPFLTLKEARNVKYNDFVQPGQVLTLQAEIQKHDERTTTLKAQGSLGESVAVSARLVLERGSLAVASPAHGPLEPYMRRRLREIFQLIGPLASPPAAGV